MNIDDSFYNRVAMARTALDLTQTQLAEKVGVVRRQIAAYEAGDSKPRDKVLNNLAAALGTTSEWLATGSGIGPDVRNIKKTITVQLIPVYTNIQMYGLANGLTKSSAVDFIPCPKGAGENAFAFIVSGDSMMSDSGISFPVHSIVTIDPEAKVKDGDFGLFLLKNEGQTIFRQLVDDQSRFHLRALNPDFPIKEMNKNIEIVGKAVHSQIIIDGPFEVRHSESSKRNHIEILSKKIEESNGILKQLLDAQLIIMNGKDTKPDDC